MDRYDELLDLVDALEHAGIDYALCGGIAVALYGYARFTKDIALLVSSEQLHVIKELAHERGFIFNAGAIPFGVGTPRERRVHRISKIEGDVITLDLLEVTPIFEEVWRERELIEWKGHVIQIVSPQGLAIMKRLAGRDQDLLDLKKLGLVDEDEEA